MSHIPEDFALPTRTDIEKRIEEFARENPIKMLSGLEVRNFRESIRAKMLKGFLRRLPPSEITMKGFEENLASRFLRVTTRNPAPLTSKPSELPRFLTGETPMSRINRLNLRAEYRKQSQHDLGRILKDDKIYTGLIAHIKQEGKATNRVIESFLASPENHQNGLTKGITNYNIRAAVKAFGQKLGQEDFIQNVQQGAVKIRKFNKDFERAANSDVTPTPLTPQRLATLQLGRYAVPKAA